MNEWFKIGMRVVPTESLKQIDRDSREYKLNHVSYGMVRRPWHSNVGTVHYIDWYDEDDKFLFQKAVNKCYVELSPLFSLNKALKNLDKLEEKIKKKE